RGDEGIVIDRAARAIGPIDLSDDASRYLVALALFAAALLINLALVRSPRGRVMIAMRENEERSRMLGYNPFTVKLTALVISGLYAGLSGTAYGLMFGYVGASLASVQYSILPLLYVLLGGAGTVLGPFLGALLMFYLIDYASSVTDAHQFVTGAALVLLVLFAPKGILGTIREKGARWLP
ncbi:MAG: branched-chain amino acid ABC transporter permease, partial [Paracoccaceae bacterium]|nr:branched-chain amino acid ABC transporter permease [Paracoccaceae bacterium]